jgi:hypothetical protein
MSAPCSADLKEMTLRQLLDAFVDARLEKREADMRTLREEIQRRQARGENP